MGDIGIDLDGTSISELLEGMAAGAFTAQALTEHCLARIAALDGHVRAVIELNPDAPEIASELDGERAAGGRPRPLHGIPVLVKDNIDTGDRMTTTAGSLALEGFRAARDAAVAARLRAAGAVILGKTNPSEWAFYRSARGVSGWSSRGGQTRNPYALDRSPDGSSSGSAVAVAAAFCAAAVGTETDGSIIGPASCNGIVGIKPTVGLVSRGGIIPIARSQDTAGPMARSVADAARLLTAMAGADPADPASEEADRRRAADYAAHLDEGGLEGARIGVARRYADYHEGIAAILDGAVDALRGAGAEIVDDVALVRHEEVAPHESLVLSTEFKIGLNAYLSARRPAVPVASLAELIEYNRAHRDAVMPHFPQDLFERAEATRGADDPAYRRARETCVRLTRTEGIDRVMARHRLDAVVTCAAGAPCLIDWVNGDHWTGPTAFLAAVSGYPSITVPAGHLRGLPVGVAFIAGAYREPTLLRLAHAFEAATRVRRPPEFKPSATF